MNPTVHLAAGRIAFSLIELLIVIAIIAILAALSLPVLNRAQESGRSTACVSNLHQIGLALQMYVDQNNNTLPIMRDAPMDTNAVSTNTFPTPNLVLKNELGNTNVLRCPSDFAGIFRLTGSSYGWNSLLNGQNANHLVVMGMNFNPHASQASANDGRSERKPMPGCTASAPVMCAALMIFGECR